MALDVEMPNLKSPCGQPLNHCPTNQPFRARDKYHFLKFLSAIADPSCGFKQVQPDQPSADIYHC
jgi:hypothetical protein